MDSDAPGPSGERPLKRKRSPSTFEDTTENQTRTGKMIDTSESDLQYHLLRVLECPICTELMKSLIFQCTSGHTICSNCISKVTLCPFCKTPVTKPVRNLTLEDMREQVTTPCPNKEHGCEERLYGNEESHEKRCPFREYTCPISQDMKTECSWKGLRKHMLEHVRDTHPRLCLTTNNYITKFVSSKDCEYQVSLSQLKDDLFVSHIRYDKCKEKFWLAVQYLGPIENTSKFKYKIKLSLPDKSREILYTRKVHSEEEDIQSLFRTDDCFTMSETQTKLFEDPNEEKKWYIRWRITRVKRKVKSVINVD